MQNDGQLPPAQRRNYKNAIDGMLRICRDEGPGVLLKGLGWSTNRAVIMTVSQMTSYDLFKDLLLGPLKCHDGWTTHFGASLLAVRPNEPFMRHVIHAKHHSLGSCGNDGLLAPGCHKDANHGCSCQH